MTAFTFDWDRDAGGVVDDVGRGGLGHAPATRAPARWPYYTSVPMKKAIIVCVSPADVPTRLT